MKFLLILLLNIPLLATASTVYLTRHYEKADGANPPLTQQGTRRANALASYLANKQIDVIYSTDYQRTRDSALPTSIKKNLPITYYSPDTLTLLARELSLSDKTVLIVGHSNTTPELIGLLGGPDVSIAEDEYGTLYILSVDEDEVTMDTKHIGQ